MSINRRERLHWQTHSWRPRFVPGMLAALIVLGSAWLLRGPRLPAQVQPLRIAVWLAPLAAQPPKPSLPPREPARTSALVEKPLAQPLHAEPSVPQAAQKDAGVAIAAERSASAVEPAAGPLNVSPGLVQSAMANSVGNVRKLAAASSRDLHSHRPSKTEALAASVTEAGIPECMSTEALKFDPPRIGPVGFSGLLAAPFWAHAALTGKCKT